ncbi:MAG: hypothetical protein LBR06_02715 [Bacteroidales bacterium]|jgi:hypothetical protein|nr:hypothetical protein [Bacteroidales bacterium]
MREEDNELKFSRANPFRVPDGYFESLDARILARITAAETPRKVRIYRILRPIIGLAACFAISFLILYFPGKQIGKSVSISADIRSERTDEVINYPFLDDNTFFNALNTEQDSPASDEMMKVMVTYVADYDLVYRMK